MSYRRIDTTDGVTVMNKELYDNLQDGIEEHGVTPEMFGAVGDGVHDDTEAIQKAIESKKLVLLTRSYLISRTIMVGSNVKVNSYGTLKYTGNGYAFLIYGSYSDVNISSLYSSDKGIGFESNLVDVSYNVLKVHTLESKGDCLTLESKDKGVVYNEITFIKLRSTNGNCISLKSTNNKTSYVGENTFYGGKCERGIWAIYASSLRHGGIPAIKCYNICMEGVTNGIFLDNVISSIFSYFRYAEVQDKDGSIILEVSGESRDNVFEGCYAIRSDKIVWTNYTEQKINGHLTRLNCPIITKTGVVIGKSALISSDGLIIEPIFKKSYVNITGISTQKFITFDEMQYSYFLSNSEGGELYLNSSYGSYGISEIWIAQTSNTGRKLKVYDNDKNLIFDGTQKELGFYHLICINKNREDKWYNEKILLEEV